MSQLYRSAQSQIKLDPNSGLYVAYVELGPIANGETWTVNRIQVFTTNTFANPNARVQCRVYRDFVGPSGFVDGTTNGDRNSSEVNNIVLTTFQKLIFYFFGTLVDVQDLWATAVVQGELTNGI